MARREVKRQRLTLEDEHRLNLRVSRRLHRTMAESHKGQWVGLVRGEVAAVGSTLDEVSDNLMRIEPDPRRRFVFRPDEDYRKKVIILAIGRQ
ncbi:MAG: hypothetical protein HY318_17735 [Armatimonadetes bacterium]|nr:hypothetical protein [Armatimonadota bacterium]